MSTSEYSKCVTVNDSYIPISKRNYPGVKKSKGCAQLPELQKYIETIIKASSERDPEDTSASEKDKLSKEIKFGKRAMCKGLDNKSKCEKVKFDMSRRKTKTKPKTPLSEAVSSGVEISNKFMPEFEDPRNWKFDKNQNLGSCLRIENFLKKLYPNPYNLSSVNEFRKSKTYLIFEKVEKDDLRDGTLSDVVISKVDAQTEVDFESPDNVIENAEFEIKSNERENHTNDITLIPGLEKCNSSPAHDDGNIEDFKNIEVSTLRTIPNLIQKSLKNKKSNSASNHSSRISSLESINEVLCKENQMNLKKRKNFKVKNTAVSREKLQEVGGTKPLKADLQGFDKNPSDYDIGKLKLLSMSDSDDSASKKFQFEHTETESAKDNRADAFVTSTNSEINDDLNKTDELCDLLQIYNVMNKATESFLLINSKTEFMNSDLEIIQNNIEDDKFSELMNEVKNVMETPCAENIGKKIMEYPENCTENKETEKSNNIIKCQIENESVRDEEKKNEKNFGNLLNIALKEELELRNNLKEINSDKTKSNSKLQNEISCSINEKDFAQFESSKKLEDNQQQKFKKEDLDTNQKIDEVLQFMYDCLTKFNNQEKVVLEKEKNPLQEDKKIIIKTSKKLVKERTMDTKPEKHLTSQFKKKSSFQIIEKNSSESLSAVSLPDVKEIKSKYTAALDELNKKQSPRTQSKKRIRVDTFVPCLPHSEKKIKRLPSPHRTRNSDSETVSTIDLDSCDVKSDSFDENNETCLQTAETQNELGGVAEVTSHTLTVPNTDLPIVKSMFPLSIKAKKSKTDTCKTLKDVLEIEEKLLADEFHEKEHQLTKKAHEKHKEVVKRKPSRALIKNKARFGYPFDDDFKRPNSNFVICLNSFPRNLRTVTIRPNVPLTPPVTFSVSDLKSWDLKPLTYYPKHHSQRFSVFPDEGQSALQCSYKVKEGALTTMNKITVVYTARPVCLKVVIYFCKLHKEFSLKNSECQVKVKLMKNSLLVESNNSKISRNDNKNALIFKPSKTSLISSGSRLNVKPEEEKPVEALIEVLKEAEEKVILLEKTSDSVENLCKNSESLCDRNVQPSASKMLRNGTSENEFEKKKIHDLLLRTHNLQQRLHQYLHKITYVQQCPLVQQEPFLDLGLFISNKTDSDISLTEFEINQQHALPLVHWCLQPPKNIKKSKTDEAVAVNVQMVDCGTSYNPPSVRSDTNLEKSNDLHSVGSDTNLEKSNNPPCQVKHSSSPEKDEEICHKLENDEDEKSSTYSFKSSNDFSEANESSNQKKEISDHSDHGDLIKKLFNKIELFRQSFEEEKLKNQDKKSTNLANVDDSNFDEVEEQKENRLVEYDPKTTAKVLKTVFKGRKSSTELTIGLKDVPMTKVNNISVEKKKFSPNHTKISICISKEKSDELRQSNKINSEILHNQFSSYYFDHIRPSLSTCQTEYSRLNDDVSKSTQSLNEESDEDEDDYKSVGSTAGDSDADEIQEKKSKFEEKETLQSPQQKNITRHKFDFYRKMDLKKDEDKGKETSLTSSWSRYKELEPLKKALTEMQIRMRSIKRDAFLNSNDYYERALKLAKMSAGFCQSCGTRAVIPDDTFGFYKTLLPRRCSHPRRCRPIRTALTPNPSFYSFRTGNTEVNDQFCDLNIKHSSAYMLNRTTHLRSSVHDMPVLFERV